MERCPIRHYSEFGGHPRLPREKRGLMGLLFSTAETVGIAAGVAVGASLLSFGTAVLVLRRLRRFRGSPEERVSALESSRSA